MIDFMVILKLYADCYTLCTTSEVAHLHIKQIDLVRNMAPQICQH